MIHWSARAATVLALGIAVSGCHYMNDWGEVQGVPLSELDMSGDAPSEIELAGPDRVVISDGDSLQITLEGDDEAGSALRFDREGNSLTIARDREVYRGDEHAIVLITMPSPSNLEIAGSGEISAASMASIAEIEIAGSGDVTVERIDAEKLTVEIAGSGSVEAAGQAEELEVEIAGSGDVNLAELQAQNVSVAIAGSGDVKVSSDGQVDASIAGSGDVVVIGSASCSVQSAGSGSVDCRPRDDVAATVSGEIAAD